MSDPLEPQAHAEQLLEGFLGNLDSREAVYATAVLLNRASVELHKLARAEAAQRRGTESWGAWAGLQNAARNLVLQSSTCRDSAAALVGRKR